MPNACLTCGRGVCLECPSAQPTGEAQEGRAGAQVWARPPALAYLARAQEQGSGCCSCLLGTLPGPQAARRTHGSLVKLGSDRIPSRHLPLYLPEWSRGGTIVKLTHQHLPSWLKCGLLSLPKMLLIRHATCHTPTPGHFLMGQRQLPSRIWQGQKWQLLSSFCGPSTQRRAQYVADV